MELEVDKLTEEGMKVANDSTVQSFEAEEIRSDLKSLHARWLSLSNHTERLRNRFACFFIFLTLCDVHADIEDTYVYDCLRIVNFQENEKKQMSEWLKQSDVFLDWMDKMDEQFAEIEEMKSEDDINELIRQAQTLKVSVGQDWLGQCCYLSVYKWVFFSPGSASCDEH